MQYDSLYKFERFLGDRYAVSGPPVLTLSVPGVVLYIAPGPGRPRPVAADRECTKRIARALD